MIVVLVSGIICILSIWYLLHTDVWSIDSSDHDDGSEKEPSFDYMHLNVGTSHPSGVYVSITTIVTADFRDSDYIMCCYGLGRRVHRVVVRVATLPESYRISTDKDLPELLADMAIWSYNQYPDGFSFRITYQDYQNRTIPKSLHNEIRVN